MTVFKTVVCAGIALVSVSGVVAAKGPSANTPGSHVQSIQPPSDRGVNKGASTYTPGSEMKQDEITNSSTPQELKGASTFAPGHNK